MNSPLWTEGASPWPHEREALAFVRARLPNHEPYRAWTNVEFIAEDGSVNEVDLLVVTPRGFFLVEIKSWPGHAVRRRAAVAATAAERLGEVLDHPLILANTKAKRLRSLLARQAPFRSEQPPWVTPLVFLSSPELDCRLHDIGRTPVCGRDPDPAPPGAADRQARTASAPLPGIVAALKDPTDARPPRQRDQQAAVGRSPRRSSRPGCKPSNRGRRVGDWELGELLDEGPGWQDFVGYAGPRIERDPSGAGLPRRRGDHRGGGGRLRREAEREFRLVQDLRHDGIAQPLDLVQAERGPALLFDRVEGEQRLDLWAPAELDGLAARRRASSSSASSARRSPTPTPGRSPTARSRPEASSSARPSDRRGLPQLVIGHWQAGARELATRLTRHPETSGDDARRAT